MRPIRHNRGDAIQKRYPWAVPSLPTLRPRRHRLQRPTAVREMLGSTLNQGVRSHPRVRRQTCLLKIRKVQQTLRLLEKTHIPALNNENRHTARTTNTTPAKPTGSKNLQPTPTSQRKTNGKIHFHGSTPKLRKPRIESLFYLPQTDRQPPRQAGIVASALGDDIDTIMSILQIVRSAEVADLAAKFRKVKHSVDRLKIILENQELISRLSMTGHGTIIIISVYLSPRKELLRSDIETLLTLGDTVILFGDLNSSTQWSCNYTNANGHIALMRRVALNVRCIETLQSLNSDQRSVLLRVGPPDGNQPPKEKIITRWKRCRSYLRRATPILNNILYNIETTDEIYNAIGALINHIATVVENKSRAIPAADSRQKLPEDVRVLLRVKKAAMRCASAYSTCENRSCAKPDNSFAIDDQEKAECLADSVIQQYSNNKIHDTEHSHRIEEEIRMKISLEPKDNLALVFVDEIQKQIKSLKIKKTPGLNGITWKEAIVIGIPKPGKPRDLPASYLPISLLSRLEKLFEKTIKTRSRVTLDKYLHFRHHVSRVSKLTKFHQSRLSGMIGRKSKMTLRKKCTLYLICIRPIMAYACPVSAHAAPNIIKKKRVVSWDTSHVLVHEFMSIYYALAGWSGNRERDERTKRRRKRKPRPLPYEPPPVHNFLRRPRNILSDPPDTLTSEVKALSEARSMPLE
ncbi:Probable RNA-directed DNA polymerase from transposon BS [Eumeta japonica]|uniref:Probable RNA-directed DNA polymerase from transposon BS n=1 Tax=Eumeta variegata TaxID=151549 RepID=A0A4C1W9S1_EUMVA|nr:Probable RNA-directed DNA polymerase from transposon BS [Eumeta japonica]